jgi:hypothetical protein
VLRGGAQTGPMLAEVVGVGAVDDRVEAADPGNRAEAQPQLGLAEVAAVGGILEVARIGQLGGVHLEQGHVEPTGQLHGHAPLDLGIRRAAPDDGKEAIGAERPTADHRQQRAVYPARVAEEHPPQAEQVMLQSFDVGHGQ